MDSTRWRHDHDLLRSAYRRSDFLLYFAGMHCVGRYSATITWIGSIGVNAWTTCQHLISSYILHATFDPIFSVGLDGTLSFSTERHQVYECCESSNTYNIDVCFVASSHRFDHCNMVSCSVTYVNSKR